MEIRWYNDSFKETIEARERSLAISGSNQLKENEVDDLYTSQAMQIRTTAMNNQRAYNPRNYVAGDKNTFKGFVHGGNTIKNMEAS